MLKDEASEQGATSLCPRIRIRTCHYLLEPIEVAHQRCGGEVCLPCSRSGTQTEASPPGQEHGRRTTVRAPVCSTGWHWRASRPAGAGCRSAPSNARHCGSMKSDAVGCAIHYVASLCGTGTLQKAIFDRYKLNGLGNFRRRGGIHPSQPGHCIRSSRRGALMVTTQPV